MNRYVEILYFTMRDFRPDRLLRNPVMFVTEVAFAVSLVLTLFPSLADLPSGFPYSAFYISTTVMLFLTIFFSNLAEAFSEGKSNAITASLRKMKTNTMAHVVTDSGTVDRPSSEVKKGDIIEVYHDEIIPVDGEIISGSCYVNESNITGESRAVMKVQGDSVTGSTKLVTDRATIKATSDPGNSFIDNMIKLIGTATRQRTPNEIALAVLLSGLTLVFLIISAVIFPMARLLGITINIIMLLVLLIALMPTTIGALLPAIGVSAINKISEFNIIAKSGRAVENAGDIDTIILDKTGTVTIGEREAVKFYPNTGVDYKEFVRMCAVSSLEDMTKEGISIVNLARKQGVDVTASDVGEHEFIPFSAETKFSGVRMGDREILKGSLKSLKAKFSLSDTFIEALCKEISMRGGTAIPVVQDGKFTGVIELNDLLKPGVKERLESIKSMNIKTIMCTGDDEVTAEYIAREAGIDEFVANVTPMDKYNVVIGEKEKQLMVAMVGDGTNDAPALAKADVGLAMNNGTPAAKEAANMVDLDNDPTKLLDVIFIGKQILITRGALTTFSIANDISKYFVIIPAIFFIFPSLDYLNLLGLTNPLLAITSALIFNTAIIVVLIPLAIRGVHFVPSGISDLLKRNLLLYGLGGVIVPFIFIKLIYVLLSVVGVVW